MPGYDPAPAPRSRRDEAESGSHMQIRRAASGDVDAIRTLVEDAHAVYLPRMGRAPAPVWADYLRLYRRLGFVETGRRVEDGYRRVFFRKCLDARETRSLASTSG